MALSRNKISAKEAVNGPADDLVADGTGFVGGDGAASVRVEVCASVVGAVQVEMDEAATAVRAGGGEE